jgi:hypothetical protein
MAVYKCLSMPCCFADGDRFALLPPLATIWDIRNRKDVMPYSTTPEKSTNQLAVWRDLLAALDQLEVAWRNTQITEPQSPLSSQLPANLATALAKATQQGTRAIAATADVLGAQLDSGTSFQSVAHALRQAVNQWP